MEKSKLMMIIIIALLVLLLGTVVGVSIYVMGMVRSVEAENDTAARSTQVEPVLTRKDIASISLGEAISTNLQEGADGKAHYAVMTMSVGYDNSKKSESEELAALLTADVSYMRSVALACLYNDTYDNLKNQEGVEALADSILARLQEEYDTTLIVEVVLSDRLIQ